MRSGKKVLGIGSVILLSLALMVTGCGGGGGSPSDVVKAFYTAANEGNYSKAESYLMTEAKMVFQMRELEAMMDEATKNGRIECIQIKGEEVYEGSVASVFLTIYFKDGSQRDSAQSLMKRNGAWKIYTFAGQ